MTSHEANDEQLMDRIAKGEATALEALHDRYAAAVTGLAFKVIGERDAAEEVAQETFWRVWRNASTFTAQRGTARNWVFTIAHRLAIDSLRRRGKRAEHEQSEIEERSPDPNADVEEAAWISMQRAKLHKALAALPVEQLQVLMLAYFAGLTRQEIARRTNSPLGTIHTRARLGLQRLRRILQASVDTLTEAVEDP